MRAKGGGTGGRMGGGASSTGVPRGRFSGSTSGMSKRGASHVKKTGSVVPSKSAGSVTRTPVLNTSNAKPKTYRKGNAAANRDLGNKKSADRAFVKAKAGRMGAEGPKRSAPVKKKGR
jgi:hypothetical protein